MSRNRSCNTVLWTLLLGVIATIARAESARAEVVTEADLKCSRDWVKQHLLETKEPKTSRAELQVCSCFGGLLCNGRAGRPLTIAGQEHERGLLTHAPSKIVVQLDSPGKTFSAIVGLDSNEQTRPGLGSVVFSVTIDGKDRRPIESAEGGNGGSAASRRLGRGDELRSGSN